MRQFNKNNRFSLSEKFLFCEFFWAFVTRFLMKSWYVKTVYQQLHKIGEGDKHMQAKLAKHLRILTSILKLFF